MGQCYAEVGNSDLANQRILESSPTGKVSLFSPHLNSKVGATQNTSPQRIKRPEQQANHIQPIPSKHEGVNSLTYASVAKSGKYFDGNAFGQNYPTFNKILTATEASQGFLTPTQERNKELSPMRIKEKSAYDGLNEGVGLDGRLSLAVAELEQKIKTLQLKTTDPKKDFEFERTVGQGASSKVVIVHCKKQSNKPYAARITHISSEFQLRNCKKEIAIMELSRSSNIVSYHSSYFYQSQLYLIEEYMGKGTLTNFAGYYLSRIPERVIAYIVREILLGLKQLHQAKRVHRDIKGDNILINRLGQIKIADFGLTTQLTKTNEQNHTFTGTPAWMAPELFVEKLYNEKVDIWALGMEIQEICNGQPPLIGLAQRPLMKKLRSSQTFPLKGDFSDQLRNFVEKCCLERNRQNRYSAQMLLSHPFIQQIGKGQAERQEFLKMLKNKQIH